MLVKNVFPLLPQIVAAPNHMLVIYLPKVQDRKFMSCFFTLPLQVSLLGKKTFPGFHWDFIFTSSLRISQQYQICKSQNFAFQELKSKKFNRFCSM